MGVKQSFEEALVKEWPITVMEGISVTTKGTNLIALWAAKWMAERCATELEKSESYRDIVEAKICADDIRKLAKELS